VRLVNPKEKEIMKKRNLLKALLAVTLVCATAAIAEKSAVVAVKGNKSSKVYHKPTCKHYTAKGSTEAFKSEAEAITAGYKACKQCGKAKAKKKDEKKPETKTETPKAK
jgi:methylphosphotriester-DNA--protein-cysteine methyltransferase